MLDLVKPEKPQAVAEYEQKWREYERAFDQLNSMTIGLRPKDEADPRLLGSIHGETYLNKFSTGERLEALRLKIQERIAESQRVLELGEEVARMFTPELEKQLTEWEETRWAYFSAVQEEERKKAQAEYEARNAKKREQYTKGKTVWFMTGKTTYEIVERIGDGALLVERWSDNPRTRKVADVLTLGVQS